MLYFPCPKCGGKVESAEGDTLSYANRHLKRFVGGSMTGHAHPILGVLATAITVGSFFYQRCPGGGRKKCENGHEFS